jgi:hypothetical protein
MYLKMFLNNINNKINNSMFNLRQIYLETLTAFSITSQKKWDIVIQNSQMILNRSKMLNPLQTYLIKYHYRNPSTKKLNTLTCLKRKVSRSLPRLMNQMHGIIKMVMMNKLKLQGFKICMGNIQTLVVINNPMEASRLPLIFLITIILLHRPQEGILVPHLEPNKIH